MKPEDSRHQLNRTVISDLPILKHTNLNSILGRGINIHREHLLSSPFDPRSIRVLDVEFTPDLKHQHFIIKDEKSREAAVNAMSSTSVSGYGFKASGSLDFTAKLKMQEKTVHALFITSIVCQSGKAADIHQLQLSGQALSYLANNNETTDEFMHYYGDHFISSFAFGAVFAGYIHIETSSKEKLLKIASELSVSTPKIYGFKGEQKNSLTAKIKAIDEHSRIEVEVLTSGVDSAKLDTSHIDTVEEMIKTHSTFMKLAPNEGKLPMNVNGSSFQSVGLKTVARKPEIDKYLYGSEEKKQAEYVFDFQVNMANSKFISAANALISIVHEDLTCKLVDFFISDYRIFGLFKECQNISVDSQKLFPSKVQTIMLNLSSDFFIQTKIRSGRKLFAWEKQSKNGDHKVGVAKKGRDKNNRNKWRLRLQEDGHFILQDKAYNGRLFSWGAERSDGDHHVSVATKEAKGDRAIWKLELQADDGFLFIKNKAHNGRLFAYHNPDNGGDYRAGIATREYKEDRDKWEIKPC